jgi:pectinesterase
MRFVLAFCGLAGAAFAADEAKPIKVVLVGDSTVNDEGGWGPGFRASFGAGIQVINLARNGRSSKSFRDEGLWAGAIAARPDYVLIQFGHNDVPGKGPERETDPKTTYRVNITRYIDDVRAAHATPILVTSIVRRNFTADGKIKVDSLAPYVAEVRAIAAENNVPLIELYNLTREQAEKAGPAGSLEIGRIGPDGKQDTTHLGPKGQQEIGRMAAREFARLVPGVRPFLIAETLRFIVDPDGSGDSKTIQYAIDHAPTQTGSQRLIIEIRPGVYHERVVVPKGRGRVTFLGKDAASTIVTAGMSAKAAGGTFLSSSVDIEADDFEAENITFENTFGVGSQAVAISVHSDRAAFRNCRFLGWQDTLYAASGRQYYKDCYIAGHVDFIFGNATVVFDDCEIHSLGAGYLTAHSRTTPEQTTGYVFRRCRLTGENTGNGVFLGRPWRPYSRVVYIDCFMGDHIRPEGWDNWRNAANESTAWYGEFGSSGPGARVGERVGWSRQLTADEAAQFRPEVFLRGADGWSPVH